MTSPAAPTVFRFGSHLLLSNGILLLSATLVAWTLVGCREEHPRLERAEAPVADSAQLDPREGRARSGISEPECPPIAVVSPQPNPAGGAASRPAYTLIADDPSGQATFDLLPLLEMVGYVPIGDNSEEWETLTMDFGVTVDPKYRRDGTCGRVVVASSVDETSLEAFVALGASGAVTFVDSLGNEVVHGQGPTLQDRESSRPPPRSSLQLDPIDRVVRSRGQVYDLSVVLEHGRWYARPVGVRYRGSDLVVVNECDPYSATDGFCGLENDGVRPLADPPTPLITSFGLFNGRDGGAAEAKIVDDDLTTGAADFPGAPLWGRSTITLEARNE